MTFHPEYIGVALLGIGLLAGIVLVVLGSIDRREQQQRERAVDAAEPDYESGERQYRAGEWL